ncbi:MAG: antibiotic biosynthesis monooxygenase [Anaerolineae bacterium]|nr:antibiotic biosynthesis monooxygenase [Anaerolineae bacterium]
MTDSIRWIVKLSINEENLDEFKKIAAKLIEKTEAEPGVLGYEWFFSEDESECCIFEWYKDSEAVLAHSANIGDMLPTFFSLCKPLSWEIYGNASDELKAAVARSRPVYFGHWGGLSG